MSRIVTASFSGGRTSAFMCYLLKKIYGDKLVVTFMDTGAEHPKTYDFIRKVDNALGLNLVCLRGDFSKPLGDGVGHTVVDVNTICHDLKPYRDMMQKYGVPYQRGMFCTSRMKERTVKSYVEKHYGKNYMTFIGIRADEPKRLFGEKLGKKLNERGLNNTDIHHLIVALRQGTIEHHPDVHDLIDDLQREMVKRDCLRYLAEISDYDKEDILDFWSRMPFDLEIPEWLGNCVFCPKKSELKLTAAFHDEPELFNQFVEAVKDNSVRVDDKTGRWQEMYRGKRSLEGVIATFDGISGNEIKSRLRGGHMTDSGSCSESCEVFVNDTL